MPLFASLVQDAKLGSEKDGLYYRELWAGGRQIDLQPFHCQADEVGEGHLGGVEFGMTTNLRQGSLEQLISSKHLGATGKSPAGRRPQPVPDCRNGASLFAAMSLNILAGNVGHELLVSIALGVEHQARLLSLHPSAAPLHT